MCCVTRFIRLCKQLTYTRVLTLWSELLCTTPPSLAENANERSPCTSAQLLNFITHIWVNDRSPVDGYKWVSWCGPWKKATQCELAPCVERTPKNMSCPSEVLKSSSIIKAERHTDTTESKLSNSTPAHTCTCAHHLFFKKLHR